MGTWVDPTSGPSNPSEPSYRGNKSYLLSFFLFCLFHVSKIVEPEFYELLADAC